MSRISTSVGPVSGLDWGSIVEKLMAVERRPLQAYQERISETTAMKTAFVDITAALTALKLSAAIFETEDYFSTATASSSNTSVMNVSVTGTPALASHAFYVDRLVRAHHVVSQGYETANESAVGGTTISIELGDSGLGKETPLGFLNGQQGVERGTIRITDRSGSSALIDLSAAVSVTDVLNAINTQADANVTASIGEQGFVITDNTGQTTTNLKVENVGMTSTATSLGIAGNVAASTITGSAVNYVVSGTSLNVLNDGLGVRSKTGLDDIRIVSSAGVVDVNVTTASTVGDVIDAINNDAANNGNLTASLSADGLSIRLVDSAGGPINVVALNGSKAAQDLGLQGKVATAGTLTGETLVPSLNSVLLRSLNGGAGVGEAIAATSLSELNGGSGVGLGTINIRDRSGAAADVNLSAATTLAEVVSAINAAAVNVVAMVSSDHLVLQDRTGSTDYTLRVQEVDSTTAADLGILNDVGASTLTGSRVRNIETGTALSLVNNGGGVSTATGNDVRIWMNVSTSFDVDLSSATTVGDVLNAINGAVGNTGPDAVTASIAADGRSIQLSGASLGDHVPAVQMLNSSAAAADLGLLGDVSGGTLSGRTLVADLAVDSRRELGALVVADRSGSVDVVDLAGLETLSELLTALNASSANVAAAVNSEGNGIEMADASGGGSALKVFSSDGTAGSLGISTGASGVSATSVNGSDLDLRYLSEKTRLEDMNGGQGVAAGKIRITNRMGMSAVVDLTQEDDILLEDVIEEINSRGINVTARINDTGDGLLLEDGSTGTGVLTVTEVDGGTTARDLNIRGQAAVATPGVINGSWELTIDVSGADGLQDVANAINAATSLVTASVINDGTGFSPYRLSIVSARTGERGRIVLDPGDTTLRFTTVQKGRDAVVRYGSSDSGSSPVLLTSSSNNFDHAVHGLSLSLVSASSSPVEVSVSRDYDYIATKLGSFVSAFNTLKSKIATYTDYNSETGKRGVLLGDATLQRLERSLSNLIIERLSGVSGSITRLGQLGISHKTTGGLQYDKEEFYEELRNNLDDVLAFFTTEDTGFAARLSDLVEEYTDPYESIFTTKSEALDRRIDLFNERVEHIAELLVQKEQRLIDQFTRMETVLGRLQSQMTAISNIRVIGLNTGSDSKKSGTLFGS